MMRINRPQPRNQNEKDPVGGDVLLGRGKRVQRRGRITLPKLSVVDRIAGRQERYLF